MCFWPKTAEEVEELIGSCRDCGFEREALLLYALEQYERGDVCAQESLRPIKDQLADAVATCQDAALYEEKLKAF